MASVLIALVIWLFNGECGFFIWLCVIHGLCIRVFFRGMGCFYGYYSGSEEQMWLLQQVYIMWLVVIIVVRSVSVYSSHGCPFTWFSSEWCLPCSVCGTCMFHHVSAVLCVIRS